jgi:hypothetical protein
MSLITLHLMLFLINLSTNRRMHSLWNNTNLKIIAGKTGGNLGAFVRRVKRKVYCQFICRARVSSED